jgi:acid phosphatase
MKKSLWALAGATALLLAGCNSSSVPTQSNGTVSGMTVKASSMNPNDQGQGDQGSLEQEHFRKIVVVIEENHGYSEVIGNAIMPYVNSLASGGALMTDSHGVTHPSEPNYFALFSGSTQGVAADPCTWAVSGPNLASELMDRGKTFAIYSEDLPAEGDTSCTFTPAALLTSTGDPSAGYRVKHNPYEYWQVEGLLPASGNKTFAEFPQGDFDDLPKVSFVVPDQWHDEHDGTDVLCDQWLQQNISAYAKWAKDHHSLLIVTWDEDDFTTVNQIATIFYGSEVISGQYSQTINHYNVLRTIEDLCHLVPTNNAATAAPIAGIFR